MKSLSTLSWNTKRHILPIIACIGLATSLFMAVVPLQIAFGAFLGFDLLRNLWQIAKFKSYDIPKPDDAKLKGYEQILAEFSQSKKSLAFYGLSRRDVVYEIKDNLDNKKMIRQSSNNLCGPIAFLNVLIRHNPALFAKTMCEYYENGYTRAPFYLQSSLWDRWGLFLSKITNLHYSSLGEGLAGAFKNAHNLLGYNGLAWNETFRGVTKPLRMMQWLKQAGFRAKSNVRVKNYSGYGEMPLLFRMIMGGLYGHDNQQSDAIDTNILNNEQPNYEFIELKQSRGNSPIHFLFNAACGHWEISPVNTPTQSVSDRIKIKL